jgi:hypothetical protein
LQCMIAKRKHHVYMYARMNVCSSNGEGLALGVNQTPSK